MSYPVDGRGDPRPLALARRARERQAERLHQGTTLNAPIPVHLSPVLVKQRVEVRTRGFVGRPARNEFVGVATSVLGGGGGGGGIFLAKPVAWDPRGFWSCDDGVVEFFHRDQIERITLLHGSAASAGEEESAEPATPRRPPPRYSLEYRRAR